MLEAYQHYFGPYPFAKDGYKLIEAPYSGMEYQSAVTYGNLFENGYLGRDWTGVGIIPRFDFIIIHESGHEWFGNSITAADSSDEWIHEGWTLTPEDGGTLVRMEQSGFRPNQQAAYQGASYGWQSSSRTWSVSLGSWTDYESEKHYLLDYNHSGVVSYRKRGRCPGGTVSRQSHGIVAVLRHPMYFFATLGFWKCSEPLPSNVCCRIAPYSHIQLTEQPEACELVQRFLKAHH